MQLRLLLSAGPFDCIFFDADRYSAPAQLSLLIPKLTPDVLLLADNVLSHPEEWPGDPFETQRLKALLSSPRKKIAQFFCGTEFTES